MLAAHRPDLQGLRAVAVLLVVLAHAGIAPFTGGFVGVDVFFVLSGYLISAMLIREQEASGRICLFAFYSRRLRRLLPAMLVMLFTTSLVAWHVLPADDFRTMLASAPYATSWTSNLYFGLRSIDYFNELATRDLFLHTWSLGVEEQFYLVWPVLLPALLSLAKSPGRGSSPRKACLVLATFTIAGAALGIAWTYAASTQAFYLTPARMWQFGLGALVFLIAERVGPVATARIHASFAALILWGGLSLIFVSAIVYGPNIAYPGAWALVPSIGAAMVIFAGSLPQPNAGSALLGDTRLAWIGDRSYSIYLWHWPVLMLGLATGFADRSFGLVALLLLTLLLAMLSYRLIELPFWQGRLSHFAPRPAILTGLMVVTIAFAGSLHALWSPTDSEPPTRDPVLDIRLDMPVIYRMGCDSWIKSAALRPCVFGEDHASRTVMFIGDSVGAQWFSAFPELFPAPQWRIVVHTKSACPIVDEDIFYKRIGGIYDICREWREAALEEIVAQGPDVVVIGSANTRDLDAQQWTDGSRRVFAQLSPHVGHVIVIGGTPKLGIDGPGCIVRAREKAAHPLTETCRGKPVADLVGEVIGHLREAARAFDNVTVFDPSELVCPAGSCSAITPNGVPVFRDHQHLTDAFARAAVPRLREALEPLAKAH